MPHHGVAARRRAGGGGGGTTSFLSLTSWSRPTSLAGTASGHQKPFNSLSTLNSAISAAVDGDYLYYSGTGVLSIPVSTAYQLKNLNPATGISIDFGTATTYWGTQSAGSSYVEFNYTGTSNDNAFNLINCSKLNIYGGSYTSPSGGTAIKMWGPISNLVWDDYYVHDAGGGGMLVNPATTAGVASSITNCTFKGEVNHWSLKPQFDSHADMGTGFHGNTVHGNIGNIDTCTFAIYAHDPLAPGETQNGFTWPEGGGGSAIECGQSPTGAGNGQSNVTVYALAKNMLMQPNGTNKQAYSGTKSTVGTGGNVLNLWGNIPLNGFVAGWLEGQNQSGAVVNCGTSPTGYDTASPAITINHGRSHGGAGVGTNLYTGGGNGSPNNVPYPGGFSIVYNDCT